MASTASCFFTQGVFKRIGPRKITEILDQNKAIEWHEAVVAASIDTFEISYKESFSYFRRMTNLENIRKINRMAILPVEKMKLVGSSAGKSNSYSLWCHKCEKYITILQIVVQMPK